MESGNTRELIVFRSKGPRDEVMLAALSPRLHCSKDFLWDLFIMSHEPLKVKRWSRQ